MPREGWYAKLSVQMPSVLLASVSAAVIDRAPVERLGRDLTSEHRHYLDISPLAPSTARSTAGRIEAARSRAPRALPATTAPAAAADTATAGPPARTR
ncbi:hypothetical protein ACWC5I_33680 [Kitasatospora sp. NPDC001574]